MTEYPTEAQLGMISSVARHYWSKLPAHAKAHIDIDDMISEAVLDVVKARRSYNNRRASVNTFVVTVARNRCFEIVGRYHQQKRNAASVAALDSPVGGLTLLRGSGDLPVTYEQILASDNPTMQYLESKRAVERAVQFGSDGLRRAIAELLVRPAQRRVDWPPEYILELRLLSQRHQITAQNFRDVLLHY